MNAEEWEKLTRNMGELLEVYPSPVINYLYSESVITSSDMKLIKSTKHEEKRMKNVLKILKEKPVKLKAFSVLMAALRLDPVTVLLADKIVGTEAKSDAHLHSKPDPHLLDEDVRRVLRAHYVNGEGSSTTLSDIRQTLKEAHVFGGQNEWDNETLLDFIWKDEFVGVEIEKVKKREGKHAKKVIYLKNIRKADPVADIPKKPQQQREHEGLPAVETLQGVTNPVLHEGAISLPTDVRDMTPENLKQYLSTVFSQQELPTQSLDVLEQQKVSGQIFLSMKEDDFVKVIPDAPFGVHRFLTIFISKIVARVETHPEQLRKFDRELRPSDKYSKGHCVEVSVNVLGKKTTPVRNFHLVEQPDKDKAYEFIGSEVIPFASACLNDRRNGTIYFGISPCATREVKAGEIVGVALSKEEVHAELRDFITKCFLENQMDIIKGSVREACFVPVTGTSDSNTSVIEVDIVPSSYVLEEDVVRTKLVPLPIYYKKFKLKEAVFRFSDEGFPKIVPAEEMYDFERNKSRMIEQRKQEELQKPLEPMPNLKVRLLNLLTGGTDVIQDTIYPFVMLSPIDDHMNQDYLTNNVPFIKHLNPEIVFDFDEKGSTDGIYKNLDSKQEEGMRVLTIENFDQTKTKHEEFEELIEGLACENRISWQFCNGYQEMSIEAMDPIDWNLKRSSAFQQSLKSFMDNFDKDRIIFIICLFSKTYKAMIEACDEVLRKLPQSWMVLAETEEIAQFLQDQMLNRNRVKKEDLAGRCVIGMPWEQVNAIICKATQKTTSSECCLPCSSGGFVPVGPKKLKDWCDINVLSS
ncbi:unnamed protein product, partial [Lymnaea stagnalis]